MSEELKIQIKADIADLKKKLKEVQNEIGETAEESAKLNKIGDGIKNVAATAGKVAAAAFTAAAAGVAAITKEAIANYAEYEQLVGGVETLFKDSANIVQGYAAEAYKTAGLSANEYMSTVTSFSASLLQSLGGDTAEAAAYADTAIIDMADNANKMGSSMESIQNAYQGFAKQNYTMLDNLKLGYGGTKEEMQRLINDANAVKEANGEMADLSIESFADVTEAIHIIQDEMGITGTTAKEASSTIQGSAASMKAAWSNLLTGLADENADFDALLTAFIDSVGAFAENLIPRISVALGGIVKLIEGLVPEIAAALPELANTILPLAVNATMDILAAVTDVLPSIVDSIMAILPEITGALLNMLPTIIDTIFTIVTSVILALADALPQILDQIVAIIPELITRILENIPVLLEACVTLLMAIVDAIPEIIPPLCEALPDIVDNIITTLFECHDILIDASIELFMALVKAIPQIIPPLIVAIAEIIGVIVTRLYERTVEIFNQIKEAISKALEKAKEACSRIFTNIKDSIKEKIESAKQAVSNTFENIRSTIRNKISSAKDSVINIFDNIRNGIKSKIEAARESVRSAIEKIKNFFKFKWELPKLKMPKISITGKFSLSPLSVPKFSISWNALGGVFDKPAIFGYGNTLQGIGENGAEAVVPLEKNLGWLDKLATMLSEKLDGGSKKIVLNVDGKTFAETTCDSINQLTRQRGSLALNLY